MKLPTETTPENLKQLRGLHEINQEVISEMLGIPKTAVSHIEKGKRAISTAEKAILDYYFFGTLPLGIVRSVDAKNALEFSEEEWGIIESLARRAGVTPSEWVTSKIRDYLTWSGEREKQSDKSKREPA